MQSKHERRALHTTFLLLPFLFHSVRFFTFPPAPLWSSLVMSCCISTVMHFRALCALFTVVCMFQNLPHSSIKYFDRIARNCSYFKKLQYFSILSRALSTLSEGFFMPLLLCLPRGWSDPTPLGVSRWTTMGHIYIYSCVTPEYVASKNPCLLGIFCYVCMSPVEWIRQ